jgi:hypothetical protein
MILFKDMQSFRDFIIFHPLAEHPMEPGGLHLLIRRLCLNTNWAARRWLSWLSWLSWLRRSGEDALFSGTKHQKSDGLPGDSHDFLYVWVRKNEGPLV